MSKLSGKTALVTGASGGIGRAIAERLAADGALVAVHYGRNEAAASKTAAAINRAGGRAFIVGAEFGVTGDVDTLFAGLRAPGRASAGHPGQQRRRRLGNRVDQPSDIADIVAFLASDDARWITGDLIDATGGTFLGPRI